jgi:hypothetical protein
MRQQASSFLWLVAGRALRCVRTSCRSPSTTKVVTKTHNQAFFWVLIDLIYQIDYQRFWSWLSIPLRIRQRVEIQYQMIWLSSHLTYHLIISDSAMWKRLQNVCSQIKQSRLKPLSQPIWQPPPLHPVSYQPPTHRRLLPFPVCAFIIWWRLLCPHADGQKPVSQHLFHVIPWTILPCISL